ncbi:fluoride efflux transporter CrcB [Oscillatoria sp. CS-180]|uniref:fluoride efflux transporter CrcB n=1 Tax=Oscillatoria sp. CS-180 TaxID=3021720 RepID=UPI002330D1DA|nr:fluoride efflux transporter CrcB [Oscillatoria sp. CS-180]MDB9524925.1 fluoride efflux transporter CrcB [Oscillatoria sp. CS-180]
MSEEPLLRAPIAVGTGAIAGALSRYYLGQWLAFSITTEFPVDTFWINLSGCFLMGFVATVSVNRLAAKPELILLITAGFLGSYTTFSTYGLDVFQLIETSNLQKALFYWVGSPILGLICLQLGVLAATLITSHHKDI